MSSAKKHHYVPQAYLKYFCANRKQKNFYSVSIKSAFPSKVKPVNTDGVCYENHLYTIQKQDTLRHYSLNDDLHIEKNIFRYEHKQIDQIFELFEKQNSEIPRSVAENLISIYLDFKRRNPVFRESFKNVNLVSKIFDKQVETFHEQRETIEKVSGKSFESFFIDLKQKFIGEEGRLEELHKRALIDNDVNGNESIEAVAKALFGLKFIILIAPSNSYFITSDNPGFTYSLDEGGRERYYNLDFGNFHGIGFPLTSRMALIVGQNDPASLYAINKNITYLKVDQETVRRINVAITFLARKIIICESDNYLKTFATYYRAKFTGQQSAT